jgi:phosphatidylglycerophosphatase A
MAQPRGLRWQKPLPRAPVTSIDKGIMTDVQPTREKGGAYGLPVWLATGLGLGLVAPAPGTCATALWGMPLAWGVDQLPNAGSKAFVIAALVLAGVPLATAAGRALGGKKDNQSIVWDEISTMPIVFLLVPLNSWTIGVAGFLLHRLMDITKPPPARQVERLPDGLGVMADDLVAAIYACLGLAGLVWLDKYANWELLSTPGG